MEERWQESDLQKRKTIATDILVKWQEIAVDWTLYVDYEDTPSYPVRCQECKQCVYSLFDAGGNPYSYSEEEILALTVAHLRQNHERVYHERSGE